MIILEVFGCVRKLATLTLIYMYLFPSDVAAVGDGKTVGLIFIVGVGSLLDALIEEGFDESAELGETLLLSTEVEDCEELPSELIELEKLLLLEIGEFVVAMYWQPLNVNIPATIKDMMIDADFLVLVIISQVVDLLSFAIFFRLKSIRDFLS